MRFTKLLTNLILEQSRFQVLYDKMVAPVKGQEGEAKKPKGLMDFDTLKAIILADPTTRVPQGKDIDELSIQDMEDVKVGKYTQWMLKNYVAPVFTDERAGIEKGTAEYKRAMDEHRRLFIEDLFKVTDDLKKYERFKNQFPQDKRDINKLTVDDVYELTKDLSLQKTKASKAEKEEAKKTYEHPGGEIMFRGSDWTLVKIQDQGSLGKDAACFYGGYYLPEEGESRWCTSSPGLSYFNTYIKDGPLYVVLPNDDKGQRGKKSGLPVERYQFHFPSNQFMDRHDRQVNLVEMLNGPMSELKEFFKPEFAKGLVSKGGNKVEINYPDSSAGKFIALYGFDELFESLPDSIEHLIVNNKSKETIALDVPDSITRFQNLDALLLSNIVRTLPENLGDLKKLKFLNLANNKDLVSLPESIKDIPNLAFINIKNVNPNVQIPQGLKDALSDEGEGFFYLK
jgi:Leucine-rich repeat (LRR) protein